MMTKLIRKILNFIEEKRIELRYAYSIYKFKREVIKLSKRRK